MLIDYIENHLRRTNTSASQFGWEALGDPNFVMDLRQGREPRRATVRRVIAYMRAKRVVQPAQEGMWSDRIRHAPEVSSD